MTTTHDTKPRRRLARRVLVAVAAVPAVAILAVVIALSLPVVRDGILGAIIARADRQLPGTFEVERARWRWPATIELSSAAWTDSAHTLARAESLRVAVRVGPLLRKDVAVRELVLRGAYADVDRIAALPFAGDTTGGDAGSGGFPRAGAIPGVPSIGVDRIAVSVDSIRAGGDVLSGIELSGGVDLLHGHAPALHVDRAAVTGAARAWGIDDVDIDVDLARGVVDGHAHGRITPYWTAALALSSQGEDRYLVTVTTRDGEGEARIEVSLERDGVDVRRVDVAAKLRTPGKSALAADPALSERMADLPDFDGVTVNVGASFERGSGVRANVDVEPNAWVSEGHAELEYRDGVVALPQVRVAVADVVLDARARIDTERVTASALVGSRGYHAGVSIQTERDAMQRIRVSPVAVSRKPLRAAPELDDAGGTVELRGDIIDITGLGVTGDFGDLGVEASVSRSLDGTYSVSARWPSPPAALLSAPGIDPAKAEALRAAWRAHGPFRLRADGSLASRGDARTVSAQLQFTLPGPAVFAAWLPDSARVDDLDRLEGRATASARIAPAGVDADADVDLSATAWIDTARVRGRVAGGAVRIDSAVVAIGSLHARLRALVGADESLDAAAHLDLDGAEFLRRFAPALPDLRGSVDARAGGSIHSPRLRATAAGSGGGVSVAAAAVLDESGSTIRARAAEPLAFGGMSLDSVEVSLTSREPSPRLFPARVSLRVSGAGVSIHESAAVSMNGGMAARVDTFDVAFDYRALALNSAFSVRVQDGAVTVDSLDMSGSMGSVRLSAAIDPARPRASRINGAFSMRMPPRPPAFGDADLWPESVDAVLRADSLNDVHATIDLDGLVLVDGTRPSVRARIDAVPGRIEASVLVTGGDSALVDARAVLAGELVPSAPVLRLDGDVDVTARVRGFPVALGGDVDRIVRVDADASLTGPAATPEGRATATATFPGLPKLEAYRVRARAETGADAVNATLAVERGERAVIDALVDYPVRISLSPPALSRVEGGELAVRVTSTDVALGELDPLLPPDVGLRGSLKVDFEARGPVDDPALDGHIVAKNVETSVAQRLRLLSSGDIRVGGTRSHPSATGEIVIENGLIRILEPAKELHPITGSATLRPDTATVRADSTIARPRTPGAAPSGDVDINVRIPAGLWIRGQGLDAELSGHLRIQLQDDRPTLTGTLRAVRGTFIFLGRSLQLDRGTVTFYGDDEANPSLDVQLSTTVDGLEVQVILVGTALEPDLTLVSSPEMPEGDIMSYLVFGKPLDNLDQDQVSLVERRGAEIAAAMGAVQLQEGLSRQLGVDLVTIRSGATEEESSAIVVGKYLSPKLLIKYERLLEEQAAQFINIEYLLTRHLKLETLYGRQDQQGIEIEWSNEY